MFDGGDDQGCDLGVFGTVGVYRLGFLQGAATTGFDCEAVGPLAVDGIKDVLFFSCGIECCGKRVLLARNPAFAGIVYL